MVSHEDGQCPDMDPPSLKALPARRCLDLLIEHSEGR